MSFAGILRNIVDGGGGVVGAALMGSDGIPIEQVEGTALAGSQTSPEEDLAAAGVEFGRLLEEVRKVSDSLAAGSLQEAVVLLGRFTVVLRAVDDEIYLVVLLHPDANLGKTRFLIRRHLLEIREQL